MLTLEEMCLRKVLSSSSEEKVMEECLPQSILQKVTLRFSVAEMQAQITFYQVMEDLPYAVLCHSCGSSEIQVSLRGIERQFCSAVCKATWEESVVDDEEVGCIFGEECPVCWTGQPVSLVQVTSVGRKRYRKLRGLFWPMSRRRCTNECIKTREPITLPLPETPFWVEQLKEREVKEGFKIFRKLEF